MKIDSHPTHDAYLIHEYGKTGEPHTFLSASGNDIHPETEMIQTTGINNKNEYISDSQQVFSDEQHQILPDIHGGIKGYTSLINGNPENDNNRQTQLDDAQIDQQSMLYGKNYRKMPKSVLKKPSTDDVGILTVLHYSPSHTGSSSSRCENECLKKSSSTAGLVNISSYNTLSRNQQHRQHYHQMQPHHHQVMFSADNPSTDISMQTCLLNTCDEETI